MEKVHGFCEMVEKLHLLSPKTHVLLDIAAEDLELGKELLIDYFVLVFWQYQVLVRATAYFGIAVLAVQQFPVDGTRLLARCCGGQVL